MRRLRAVWELVSGLRGRLALLVAVAVLPATAVLFYVGVQEHRTEIEEFHSQTLDLARLAAQTHYRRIEAARQLLISLSTNPVMVSGSGADCTQLAKTLVADFRGLYAEIGRAGADGVVDCHALDTPGPLTIGDRAYFRTALAGRFAVGDFMLGKISRQPTIGFGYPLAAGTTTRGVIFANIDLLKLSESLQVETRIPSMTISLLDANGMLIARSSDADHYIGTSASKKAVDTMRQSGDLVAVFAGPDRVRRVFGMAAVHAAGDEPVAYAVVGIPETHVAALVPQRGISLLVILLFGVGTLGAAWIGAETMIRRPIASLTSIVNTFGAGRLDVRAPKVGGLRELDTLATTFNQMATQLEQREVVGRERQRLEGVGQLAGGIAHDFNNLLQVICGFGEVLSENFAPGTVQSQQLLELRKASDRAAQLTKQLLAYSRRQVLMPTMLQLNDVIQEMESLLRHTTGGAVVIALDLERDLKAIEADRSQMEQVILNLVINARDAMPSGGTITITTRTAYLRPEEAESMGLSRTSVVQLLVSDTGIGMDAATKARIFEPFFSTKGVNGTGLGLATVYGIVKQSGGHIACQSEVGAGTCFWVVMPQRVVPATELAPAASPSPIGGSEAILVVDDEPAIRLLVETILKRAGYAVSATSDPDEALYWIGSGRACDLLLSDLSMPVRDGLSLVEAARELRPQLPAALMSGHGSPFIDSRPDAVAFLQKPIEKADLLRLIRSLLDQRVVGHDRSGPRCVHGETVVS